MTMRDLSALLIAIVAVCVAASARNIRKELPEPSESHLHPLGLIVDLKLLPFEDALTYTQPSARLKRDGAGQGFFDDDYASDADWTKFTNKGGALVRVEPHGNNVS